MTEHIFDRAVLWLEFGQHFAQCRRNFAEPLFHRVVRWRRQQPAFNVAQDIALHVDDAVSANAAAWVEPENSHVAYITACRSPTRERTAVIDKGGVDQQGRLCPPAINRAALPAALCAAAPRIHPPPRVASRGYLERSGSSNASLGGDQQGGSARRRSTGRLCPPPSARHSRAFTHHRASRRADPLAQHEANASLGDDQQARLCPPAINRAALPAALCAAQPRIHPPPRVASRGSFGAP